MCTIFFFNQKKQWFVDMSFFSLDSFFFLTWTFLRHEFHWNWWICAYLEAMDKWKISFWKILSFPLWNQKFLKRWLRLEDQISFSEWVKVFRLAFPVAQLWGINTSQSCWCDFLGCSEILRIRFLCHLLPEFSQWQILMGKTSTQFITKCLLFKSLPLI